MPSGTHKISIGIDFGTTNTTVCLAIPHGKDQDGRLTFLVECLKFNDDGTGGKDYVPTVVLYDTRPNSDGSPRPPLIGHEAMHPVLDGEIQPATHRLCVHSKFLLGQESMGDTEWQAYLVDNPEYASKPNYLCYDEQEYKPSRVVRDFFHVLFGEILQHYLIQGQKSGGTVSLEDLNVVITCPEAWKHGLGQHVGGTDSKKHAIRSHHFLKEILGQLGLGAVEIKTEPEAATVYFAKHLETAGQPEFTGQVMIVDYGGGTLDICLSRLERKQGGLVVTPELGDHHAVDGRSVAGVKFDEALFELAWEDEGAEQQLGESLEQIKKTPEYVAFLYKLDHEKRERWLQTTEKLRLAATKATTEDAPCFRVPLDRKCRLGATPSRMVQAFETANKPTLLQCLEGFNQKLGTSPEERSQLPENSFRLLMVGGFSRLELARRTVLEHFGWNADAENACVARFSDEADTAYAIAKGAALIAARWAHVEAVVPFNIGVVSHSRSSPDGRVRKPILNAGAKVSECADWVYCGAKNKGPSVYQVSGLRARIEFFISQGQEYADIPLNRDPDGQTLAVDSVLPIHCKDLHVAFRFDETEQEPWVRFEDANNKEAFREHRLGELIRRARNQPALSEEEEA